MCSDEGKSPNVATWSILANILMNVDFCACKTIVNLNKKPIYLENKGQNNITQSSKLKAFLKNKIDIK